MQCLIESCHSDHLLQLLIKKFTFCQALVQGDIIHQILYVGCKWELLYRESLFGWYLAWFGVSLDSVTSPHAKQKESIKYNFYLNKLNQVPNTLIVFQA